MTAQSELPPDHEAPTPAPPQRPSPGAQLRAAREAADLSVESFAAQTKLTVATLEALEADDFGALLEPVYVRGYYRKCARLLGLSEEELIAAYNARVAYEPPRPPTRIRLSASADVSGTGGGLGRWLGLLLLLAIAGLVGYLFFAPTPSPPGGMDEGASFLQPSSVAEIPNGSPSVNESAPAAVAATAAPAPVVTPAPTEQPEAQAGVATDPVLALAFREASWVRINDATGRALMNGLMDAGARETIRGEPPYQVFLGNAPGVELSFAGRRVDLGAVTQSNRTARLTLPAAP